MADVTLVFGNGDRLLPIDYETVELGADSSALRERLPCSTSSVFG